jgi:hypothetical protein
MMGGVCGKFIIPGDNGLISWFAISSTNSFPFGDRQIMSVRIDGQFVLPRSPSLFFREGAKRTSCSPSLFQEKGVGDEFGYLDSPPAIG